MGGAADFDEKDTHRRVLEAIPHRPLGTALTPIRYERAGLPQLSEQVQRIFEADLLVRVRIVEEIATKSVPGLGSCSRLAPTFPAPNPVRTKANLLSGMRTSRAVSSAASQSACELATSNGIPHS